jgi:hypothetical protein
MTIAVCISQAIENDASKAVVGVIVIVKRVRGGNVRVIGDIALAVVLTCTYTHASCTRIYPLTAAVTPVDLFTKPRTAQATEARWLTRDG